MDAEEVERQGRFDEIEPAFHALLRESLDPRGPDSLDELVDTMGLPPGSRVVDVGCGRGDHAVDLARRHGFDVLAIDPFDRFAIEPPERGSVEFRLAPAEAIPADDGSVDLAYCRDSFMFVDLDRAMAELRRVLRPGGRGLLYLVVTGPSMTDAEAAPLHEALGGRDLRPSEIEEALTTAGFVIDETVDFGGEWGERAQEREGKAGERLLFASRLLRRPQRYIDGFGEDNYRIMLNDCLWHVYRMIGKLAGYAVVFTRP